MILNHEFTNSSMLSDASYDTEANELTLTFNNGKKCVYEDVDKATYEGLITARSIGAYFAIIKKELKVKK